VAVRGLLPPGAKVRGAAPPTGNAHPQCTEQSSYTLTHCNANAKIPNFPPSNAAPVKCRHGGRPTSRRQRTYAIAYGLVASTSVWADRQNAAGCGRLLSAPRLPLTCQRLNQASSSKGGRRNGLRAVYTRCGYNYDSTSIRRPFDCLPEVIEVIVT